MRKIVHQTWIENETELNALQTEPLFFSAQTTPNFSREVRSLKCATGFGIWCCSPIAANFAGGGFSPASGDGRSQSSRRSGRAARPRGG
jgi:hypothetical protein